MSSRKYFLDGLSCFQRELPWENFQKLKKKFIGKGNEEPKKKGKEKDKIKTRKETNCF